MAKQKANTQYQFPPKTDNVFRIYLKTNSMGSLIVLRFELSTGEAYTRNYGNIPSNELLIEYKGNEFELYIDGEYVGQRVLIEADRNMFRYATIE
ncbi:hypothetical protein ACU1JV_00530 [Paenibacillus sp. T2-29]|uniref:Uncharacterized protein n=1 Tax=Paenibacillus peoriae TaxID=59893 RepID=A0A7H0Y2W7_9BACL|nr:hypothetical protein [Paenibacillus peoriae]QNR65425.1 hypothetical protein IAQ67_16145 [Paenibacillus peoriae]